eukprot:scaffold64189_cov35-Tisochrysis_lutea.AAC.1
MVGEAVAMMVAQRRPSPCMSLRPNASPSPNSCSLTSCAASSAGCERHVSCGEAQSAGSMLSGDIGTCVAHAP